MGNMVNKTMGGVGADYADINAVFSALSAASPLSDDWTITQTGSFTLSANASLGFDINGRTVTFDVHADGAHKGDNNVGYSVTCPYGWVITMSHSTSPVIGGTVEFNGYHFVTAAAAGAYAGNTILNISGNGTSLSPFLIKVKDCIFEGTQTPENTSAIDVDTQNGTSAYTQLDVSNLKIFGLSTGFGNSGAVSGGTPAPASDRIISNVSVYDCTIGFYLWEGSVGEDLACTYENCYALSCGTDYVFNSTPIGKHTINNCADSDETLTYGDNVITVTPADEFESLDSTESNFLHPSSGGSIVDGGITPSIVTLDIAGLTYGGNGQYPIGCHQYTSTELPCPLFSAKTTIGAKEESTPYTFDQPTSDDYNFRAFDIDVSTNIEHITLNYLTGEYSKNAVLQGKRLGTIFFSTHITYGGADTTKPAWSKLLEACGYIVGEPGSGIVWMTDSNCGSAPLSIEVQIPQGDNAPDSIVLQFRGCKGNATFVQENIGNAMRIDFEFTGVLSDIVDRAAASVIKPTIPGPNPEPVLESTITAFGDTIDIETLTLNTNNETQLYTDPSKDEGVRGVYIVDRAAPSLRMDPYANLLADSNVYNRWVNGTTGTLSMTIGDNFTLVASAIQVTEAYGTSDREEMLVNQIGAVCTKVGADQADGVIMLVQGSD